MSIERRKYTAVCRTVGCPAFGITNPNLVLDVDTDIPSVQLAICGLCGERMQSFTRAYPDLPTTPGNGPKVVN